MRFGKETRLAASFAFITQMILYMGIVVYAPALALQAVTGLDKTVSIIAVGLVCTFYSTIGGMKAVLVADVFQVGSDPKMQIHFAMVTIGYVICAVPVDVRLGRVRGRQRIDRRRRNGQGVAGGRSGRSSQVFRSQFRSASAAHAVDPAHRRHLHVHLSLRRQPDPSNAKSLLSS